jgi:hypothetical protein
MDAVAAQFPGKLRFLGAPAGRQGVTEIRGNVDKGELLQTVRLAEYTPDRRFPWRLVAPPVVAAAAVHLLHVVF